ncbi:hypothetical protein [Salinibacter ruber]|uniref:hypothetical protein n=1 Tax=Salinibacter ruber TaxID=146919 RepID=UPI00216945F3|nr:hypothetical protein [Salinibacter ruber]MCS4054069.1 hypothetical protein [Salinibacter ruber]
MDNDDLNRNRNAENLSDLTGGEEEPQQGEGGDDEPTKRYTLDLPQSLHKWLKKQAIVEEERSMKEITIDALQEYRRKHE